MKDTFNFIFIDNPLLAIAAGALIFLAVYSLLYGLVLCYRAFGSFLESMYMDEYSDYTRPEMIPGYKSTWSRLGVYISLFVTWVLSACVYFFLIK